VEHLGVLQNVGSIIDEKLASDEDNDRSGSGSSGLSVEGQDSVNDLGEWQRLVVNVCRLNESIS